MSTSRDELLACPFCGPGNSIVECYQDDTGYWKVGCGACGSHSGIRPKSDPEGRAKVIASWNRTPARLAATPKAGVDREVIARALEGIILRRAHEKRIEGYTLEMSLEQADAILSLSVGEQEIVQASIPDGGHSNEQSAQGLSRATGGDA